MSAVPAKPPTFHFKIRLVDATGWAGIFEGRDYQLWWGGKVAQEGKVGMGGYVEADLDDAYDAGNLDLGERGALFVPRITIPIEVVLPPPPPPAPPEKTPAPPPNPKHEPQTSGWTDEADPPPPRPSPIEPNAERDPVAAEQYRKQSEAWDAWEARRDARQREAEEQRRWDEEFRANQEHEQELDRQWKGAGGAAPPRAGAAPPMSPAQRKAARDDYQRLREQMHAAKVMLYELAYRLRNLGYLPDVDAPSFPIEGSARTRLLHAARRYANKNGLVPPPDLDAIEGDEVKKVHEAVKKEHDG